jgi:predicted enzyme related to lactoylglutathione lyase
MRLVVIALLALMAGPSLAKEASMPAPIVFFDIAGPDHARQAAFYAVVFGWNAAADGNLSVPVASPIPGSLRADPADKVIYIGVPDVTATLAKIKDNGGSVDTPRFEVKGVAVIGLFRDPAGNRMGLVEIDGAKPKVP